MNGIPSTDNASGVQPGDAGDAGGDERCPGWHAVQHAQAALEQAVKETGDSDLARALAKVTDWVAREEGRILIPARTEAAGEG